MEIRTIGIAGAGTMGASMAQIYAEHFDSVILYNHRTATLEQAEEKIRRNTAELVQAGALSESKAEHLLHALCFTTDLSRLGDCDVIAENLAENTEIKHAFFQTLSPLVREDAILTTNTSGLSVNLLAHAVQRPERFLGMHWFNPPHLVPLVEIIRGEATGEEIAQAVYALALKIRKKPVFVNQDVPGFAANRIQYAILREALDLVQRGVISPEGIDDVMKYGLGFRYACLGPLEVADFGGLDVFYHISEYLMQDLCNSPEIPALMAQHYNAGEYGVKNGKGFYDYSGKKAQEQTELRNEKFLKLYRALYGEESDRTR